MKNILRTFLLLLFTPVAMFMDFCRAFLRCFFGFFEWVDKGVFVYDDRYVFAYDKDTGIYIPLYKELFTYKIGKRIYLIWLPISPESDS